MGCYPFGVKIRMRRFNRLISLCMSVIILSCCITITASAENDTAYIQGTNVNVRSEASTKSKIIDSISDRDVVVVEKTEGENIDNTTIWYKIKYDDKEGYVHGNYVYERDPWNSRRKSIIRGAQKYADGYISIGQDTYYYKDFNVVNKIWWHQYASALYDAWTNGNILRKAFADEEGNDIVNKDAVIEFRIPVYRELPQNPCVEPNTLGQPSNPIETVPVTDVEFEKTLEGFPEDYRNLLRTLHATYPNWKFVAHDVDLTFNQAVEEQYGVSDIKNTRKWVEFTYGGNEWRDMRGYNAETNQWLTLESRWTYASRAAIEYFIDPRNSLNDQKIFVFALQSYNKDTQTKDGLRTVVADTFLANGYDGNPDAYLDDIMEAARLSGVSPYVLAATIIVEQGVKGETNLISGTYPNFEGYYNFFNFAASGATKDDIAVSGLTYAKDAKTLKYLYDDPNGVIPTPPPPPPEPVIKKGDTSGDDVINAIDLAAVKMHILGVKKLDGNAAKAGDVNGDGDINAIDLAAIKMHILGVKTIG